MVVPFTHRRDVADLTRAIDRLLEVAATRKRRRDLDRLERRFAAALRKVFRKQERAVVRALRGLKLAEASVYREMLHGPASGIVVSPSTYRMMREAAEPDWEALYDTAAAESDDAFTEALTTFLTLAISAGAVGLLVQLGLPATAITMPTMTAAGYAQTYAAELVAGINEVTKAEIRRIIANAVKQGLTSGQVAAELRATYATFYTASKPGTLDRAARIAYTELANAYEAGAEAAAVAAGNVEKSWVTMNDTRVDAECRGNEAQGWIPIGDAFSSGHMRPLAHPGCRCRAEYRRVVNE